MKKGFFIHLVTFLTPLWLCVPWLGHAEVTVSLAITHSMLTYSSDGSTMTVTLNLEIQNTGASDMNEITMVPAILRKTSLLSKDETAAFSIRSLDADENVITTYTLTTYIIYPEEWIERIPIFWKITYFDNSNQEVATIIASRSATK